jgi:hypothetical protein
MTGAAGVAGAARAIMGISRFASGPAACLHVPLWNRHPISRSQVMKCGPDLRMWLYVASFSGRILQKSLTLRREAGFVSNNGND